MLYEKESKHRFMDFLEKDERDYISNVLSLENSIRLLLARAFNAELNPDIKRSMQERFNLSKKRVKLAVDLVKK